MTIYLKRFIPYYGAKTYPFLWNDECEQAFEELKTILLGQFCICYFDDTKNTMLFTDANPYRISSIPLQQYKDTVNLISCTSRSLRKTEHSYSQIERECLGLRGGCKKIRLYLFGKPLKIFLRQ